jgi:hypothetical protein
MTIRRLSVRVRSFAPRLWWLSIIALTIPAAVAGTLVFPQTSRTYVEQCDNGFTYEQAPNSNGCNTWANFVGGQFIAPTGVTQYVASSACFDRITVSFSGYVFLGYATNFTTTLKSGDQPGSNTFTRCTPTIRPIVSRP